MPRREGPLRRVRCSDWDQAAALIPAIEPILQAQKVPVRNAKAKRRLIDDLVHAVGFAKAGLPDIEGSRAKPAAWLVDIFVRDVCDALKRAKIPALVNPCAAESHAQALAKDLADVAGLPNRGQLFHQMQRAGRIEKPRVGDATLRDGRIEWQPRDIE